jgi:PRTRC genetic system protein B
VLPGDIKVEVDPLQLRFDFHKESVLLTDYSKSGSTRTKLVSALDVAHALASELDLSSGVLPPDCLWFSKTAGGSRVAIWCPAQVWHVSVKLDIDDFRKLKLPMPGLVFICQQGWQSPFVFAARKRPTDNHDQLYHCPTFNVFSDGRVCPGTHKFPADPSKVPADFFRSNFSLAGNTRNRSQKHPEDLAALWNELHNQSDYPLDDLVPALQVIDAMRVGA